MDMNDIFGFTVIMSRYLIAMLAVLVLGSCVVSLVTRRFGKRVGSYLVQKNSKKRYPLTRWENAIGRSATCDLVFDVPTVSRFHAVISKRRGGWVVADTNSRTGVLVNGEKITKVTKLNHGDTVTFGTAAFEFFDVDVDDMERAKEKERRRKAKEAAKATRAARPEKSAAFLPALIDEAAQKAYVLGCESCVVGRSPDCDVKLRYSPISSEHAKIYKNGTAWFIEDMNSATGTKVNARAVGTGRRRLKDGDIIGLGGVIFVFNEYYKIKK